MKLKKMLNCFAEHFGDTFEIDAEHKEDSKYSEYREENEFQLLF